MRKLLLSALALCLLTAGAGPTAAGVSASAGGAQFAWADWIDMDGRTGTIYGALGIRGVSSVFGAESVGVVFKGRCKRYRDGNGVIIMCGAGGMAKTVGPQEFWVDPLLDSASLDMTADGFDHSVDWIGRRGDEYGRVTTNDRRTIAYNEMWKMASTNGTVYGQRIPERGFWKMGFLYEAAGVRVRHKLDDFGVRMRDDGTIGITKVFRVPD